MSTPDPAPPDLTVKLILDQPSGDAEAPAAQEDSPQRWVEAGAAVQTTAKWLITAFAAVGAVMFAKGFVTTPKLSWRDDTLQLLAAWALGAVGIGAIGVLIWMISQLLLPTVFTTGSLPEAFVAAVESPKEQRDHLPTGTSTVEELRANLLRTRRSLDSVRLLVRQRTRVLEAARAQHPADPARVQQAEQELDEAEQGRQLLEANLQVYLRARQNLLNRAAYWKQQHGYTLNGRVVASAAVVAAVCGIGYQLVLSAPDPKKEDAAEAGGAVGALPAAGELIRSETAAGAQLWTGLGLARCQAEPGRARIPVLVTAGAGVQSDPYRVTTVASGSCPALSFTVVDDVARVVVPEPLTITYTPVPSASA